MTSHQSIERANPSAPWPVPAEIVCDLLEFGFSQNTIAERSGVHQTTISKLARGDITDVMSQTYRTLLALHQEIYPPSVTVHSLSVGAFPGVDVVNTQSACKTKACQP